MFIQFVAYLSSLAIDESDSMNRKSKDGDIQASIREWVNQLLKNVVADLTMMDFKAIIVRFSGYNKKNEEYQFGSQVCATGAALNNKLYHYEFVPSTKNGSILDTIEHGEFLKSGDIPLEKPWLNAYDIRESDSGFLVSFSGV